MPIGFKLRTADVEARITVLGQMEAIAQLKFPVALSSMTLILVEILGDLVESGQTLRVAKGGKGGLGNKHFLSNRNRAPEYALPGLPESNEACAWN
jgi:GTPase involved in cell partitioning and DNA repair